MDGLRRCRGVVKVGDGTDGVRIVGGVLSGLAAGPEGGGTGGGSDTMRNLLAAASIRTPPQDGPCERLLCRV